MRKLLIGIDTGVNTGVACYDGESITFIETMLIHNAWEKVMQLSKIYDIKVLVEDARKRGNSGKLSKARAQGAGSVKRDAKAWEDFLTDYEIKFQMVAPSKQTTKIDKDRFRGITGCTDRTSNHARDAAMMIWGRSLNF